MQSAKYKMKNGFGPSSLGRAASSSPVYCLPSTVHQFATIHLPATIYLLLLALTAARASGEEFYEDFAKTGGEGAAMRIEGQKASQYVERTPAGLKISLPERQSLLDAIGVLPKFGVRGDFEITARYELVKADPPGVGYGSGVSLRVLTNSSANDGATLARFLHPKDGQVYSTDRAADRGRGDRSHQGKKFPTEATSGKLRLTRQGSTLHFLVAKGDSGAFEEIWSVEFVPDDVASVRLAADPGRSKSPLEVRLIDFHVRADALPVSVGRRTAPYIWLIWFLAALAGVSVVVVLIWKVLRPAPPVVQAPLPDFASRGPG